MKHTNLTGCQPAYLGGELIKLDREVLLLNGSSGRYPASSAEDLMRTARAFWESGYSVWCMGYDQDTNHPLALDSQIWPEWVS